MATSQAVLQQLPFLRRYARALSGSQNSGDAYVAATLEALIAKPEVLDSASSSRVGLYRLFTKIWNSVPVNGTSALQITLTNPNGGTVTNYYLNSLQDAAVGTTAKGPGVSNHTTYGIDYMATIKAMGGATIRMIAADSNCSMIKNCGPTVNDGSVCTKPIIMSNIEPTAVTANPTFSFQTAYNGQWIVMTVKSVTSP